MRDYKDELQKVRDKLNMKDKSDDLAYVDEFVGELTDVCKLYHQNDIELVDNRPRLVDRVFQILRPIPYIDLDSTGIYRIPFINGGMYFILPTWILPGHKIDKCRKNRWKAVLNPESEGLPSSDRVNYSTINILPNGNYVALPKNLSHPIFDHILSAKHIKYVI